MKRNLTEPCEYCDGTVHPSRVTAFWRHEKNMVAIEGVPAGVCNRCGERYYDAEVVRRMELIVKHRDKAKRRLKVPVMKFDTVA
jgi:YgiT-type zinc finger domain-containing protein